MNTTKPLAVVRIDLVDLLLPADKALQLVALLQSSGAMSADYANRVDHAGARYVARPLQQVSLEVLQPGAVVLPTPAAPTKRAARTKRATEA